MSKFQPAEVADTLSAPLGEFISAVGKGVADAQQAMDLRTAETFKAIHKGDDKTLELLRQLGYQPTWYKIPEVEASIQVSLNISGSSTNQQNGAATQTEGSAPIKLYAAPMDADYANRYNYNLSATSQLKFKIVPVPPSTKAAGMKVIPAIKTFLS